MKSVTKKAFAKINLTLEVGKKRADGYHTIRSVMARASLFDTLEISENDCGEIRVFSNDSALENEDNLCVKGARAYFREKGISGVGVDIRLEKRIPVKSGLGGGSADCASTIIALEELYGELLPEAKMRIARSLGADVPYCFMTAPALCEGIGDECHSIIAKEMDDLFLVIIKKGEKLSTGKVYSDLDKMKKINAIYPHEEVIKALEKGDKTALAHSLFNDFERVVLPASPSVSSLKEELYENGALGVVMSGAGPSLVALFDDEKKARKFGETYKILT